MLKTLKKFFNLDTTTRIYLFFISVVLKLLASALSGVAFVKWSGPLFIAGTVVWIIWFGLLFLIARPQTDNKLASQKRHLKPSAITVLTVLLLVGSLEFAGVVTIGLNHVDVDIIGSQTGELLGALQHSFAYNDGTSLCHQAAQNLLDGQNPYATANIISANIEFNNPYDKTTPIRTGRFADAFPYPKMSNLKVLWDEAVKTPNIIPPEIESRLNYPAACFLVPAAFLYAGITDLRLIYLILIIPVILYVVYKAPIDKRFWLLGAFLVSLEIWNGIASGETGTLYFPFLLMAWVLLRRRLWLSALFMGIAVAIKQVPWFFMPFYLILIFRTYNFKNTAGVLGIVAVIFIAFNLLFIIPDPKLWLDSVLTPMTANFFPLGVGIITLVTGGYLQIESPLIFSLLAILVGVIGVVWYWFNCWRYPHSGLILAVLPLFFAWRSLWPYFFYFDVILITAIILDEYANSIRNKVDNRQAEI
jgi:hypothetical protein